MFETIKKIKSRALRVVDSTLDGALNVAESVAIEGEGAANDVLLGIKDFAITLKDKVVDAAKEGAKLVTPEPEPQMPLEKRQELERVKLESKQRLEKVAAEEMSKVQKVMATNSTK